jgi:2'-5' RNA ligase
MSRIFVAISLPELVKSELQEICYGVPGARWEDESKIHLSLRFIGEVDGLKFQDIQSMLAEIRSPAFFLEVKGVGFFPPKGETRILWAGLTESEDLRILQKKVESGLVRKAGLKPEGRKYYPHITVARLKRVHHRDVAMFIQRNSLLHLEPFEVKEFHLYTSVLSSKGSKYYIESSYPLEG